MKLETSRFGPVEVDQQDIITFTQPILGFQEYRRYVLLPGPGAQLRWLQSTDSSDLAFILLDPLAVMPDYHVELRQHDLAELAASTAKDLEVYTLVVVPQDPSQVRTNLKAPILINTKQRLGKQIILDTAEYPVQFFLAQAKESASRREAAPHARINS
jgi:flagellar assembly factor FliW